MKVAYLIQGVLRTIARLMCPPLIWLLMPLKSFAYRTNCLWLKGGILEVASFLDFLMVLGLTQNGAMQCHAAVYKGNFLFGRAVMVVEHEKSRREIAVPALRGNRFMGIDIVSNDSMVFVTNAGPISTGQPTRGLIRGYIEREIMTERVRSFDAASLRNDCEDILKEWSADERMAQMWPLRGAATRIVIHVLAGKTLSKTQLDAITFCYARRFVEFSLFGRYLPGMLGLLGTREVIRRDAYIPLRQQGIDNLVIDMTLFAAMFSIGTIVIKCVEFARIHQIDYGRLLPHEKTSFVIESLRLYPTVTTVHRIVENEEQIQVRGKTLRLRPGDEVAYPFICINRDPKCFTRPDMFRLDRPREELSSVLSWSAGPHVCPAKDLSILVTVMMLDQLATRFDLRELRIDSLEF